jgi:hypothetical protein
MENLITKYSIPDLKSGYSVGVSKEEYEKFMETWESIKYQWEEKWKGDYAKPSIHSYIPMPEIDNGVSPKGSGTTFIMDMKNPMMEFESNGTFLLGERIVYMIDNSPYDLDNSHQGMIIYLDGKLAKLLTFERDLMNRQDRPLVDKGQPTGLIVKFI